VALEHIRLSDGRARLWVWTSVHHNPSGTANVLCMIMRVFHENDARLEAAGEQGDRDLAITRNQGQGLREMTIDSTAKFSV